MMTVLDTEADAPPVLIVNASELGARSGRLLRHLATGAVIRVDDLKLGVTVGWLTAEAPPGVAGLQLPGPGEVSDVL
jgi:hypothetical protein